MAAMAMTHTAHAMTGSFAGLNAWSATDPCPRARVSTPNVSGTLAVHAAAFAVHAGAFTMDCLSILGM